MSFLKAIFDDVAALFEIPVCLLGAVDVLSL